MPIIDLDSRLQVVVGIIENDDGKYLVQQRREGKPCAGQWEFPGGKIENRETPEQALQRELFEELDIEVTGSSMLTKLAHNYDHAKVLLWIYYVEEFKQIARGKEGQVIAWVSIEEIRNRDVLEAVFPILELLENE